MGNIVINLDRCIGCSLCAKDCPAVCIVVENGKAKTFDQGCIGCGHCYSVCPQSAIQMTKYDCIEEPVTSMEEIDNEVLLKAMKSRRSTRQFKNKEVEEEKIKKILEAGRYAPTGANAQDVQFIVLGSKQDEAEKICVKLFRTGTKLGSVLMAFLRRVKITDDFFFKGAPLVIVVTSKHEINGGLASAYMEIMANSLGLGVLYSGFFVGCTGLSARLRKIIEVPKGHKVVSCMVMGYPAVKYKRIAPRKEAQVKIL